MLDYQIRGQGAHTLLFLHGFLEDQSMWVDILSAFDLKKFQLITIDLPGHGKSFLSANNCSMNEMATEVLETLSGQQKNKLSIIGHSMGGYVGLEMLKHSPGMGQLILLNSNFWSDPPQKKTDRNRVIAVVRDNKDRFIREAIPGLFAEQNRDVCRHTIVNLIKKATKMDAASIIAATAGMRDRLDNYQIMEGEKVHLIHGALDPIISGKMLNEKLQKIQRKVELINLEECGHMSVWESREALIAAIKGLLIP